MSNELTKQEPLDIDITGGILPKSYNELLQMAALYQVSGLAPKSFTSHQQIAVAMAMCLEVGRPIITGLQDMAVINGRVGVFGDAALAMVRASGKLLKFHEWSEGEPLKPGWNFYCLVKRAGDKCDNDDSQCSKCPGLSSCGFVGGWTWTESIQAGFHEPKTKDGRKDIYSPWTRFTRRMMQFKARNFVLRDKFGDVLRGITIVEDLQDVIEMTQTSTGYTATTEKTNIEKKLDEIPEQQEEKLPDKPPKEEEPPPAQSSKAEKAKLNIAGYYRQMAELKDVKGETQYYATLETRGLKSAADAKNKQMREGVLRALETLPDKPNDLITCPKTGDQMKVDFCNSRGEFANRGCKDRDECTAWYHEPTEGADTEPPKEPGLNSDQAMIMARELAENVAELSSQEEAGEWATKAESMVAQIKKASPEAFDIVSKAMDAKKAEFDNIL